MRDDWYQAIWQRHSRRQFAGVRPDSAQFQQLSQACDWFHPFSGVRSVLVEQAPSGIFRGAVGTYGSIKGASAYLAFIGATTIEHAAAKTGYLGEGLILEATRLGLATCWVGGLFHPRTVARQVELAPEEKVYCVSPVGLTDAQKTVEEKAMSWLARSHKRKPLEVMAERPHSWPEWGQVGLEAARCAPSAMNLQPWLFRLEAAGVTVSQRRRSPFAHLDCGIAMLHFELGARHAGVRGHWEFLQPPDIARFVAS